jgi:mRNA-degrading endonuclease toxin of MazEF toxin-antitoxin module
MPALSKGDIVIAYFPQEDHSTSDLRPCLVLSAENGNVLAAKITTTSLCRTWVYKLDKGTSLASKGKIEKDSWVNLRRRETIPVQDIKKIVATLKPDVFRAICIRLNQMLKP